MRPALLVIVIAISAAALGYMDLKHKAERADWRLETARLSVSLERAERLAEERAEALAKAEPDNVQEEKAKARLADLEARILDAAADIALLESDRVVAEDRAAKAVADLERQVRTLTSIEMAMASLDRQRQRLESHVGTVEQRLDRAETDVAERQRRAEALDHDIADLVIRRETVLSGLQASERMMAETALATAASSERPSLTPPSADAAASPRGTSIARAVDDDPAIDSVFLEDDGADGDRTRGLYQFGSLSAMPGADGGGESGIAPSSNGAEEEEDASWAEDQYLLGLTLLSTAEQGSGTRELSEAVLAFKAVLGEWPKVRDPMRWAIARSDLGYALALLGRREGNADILEQATAASRDALAEFAPDDTPMLWAAAQHHLGVSLGGLADMRDDQDLWQQSIDALERSIATFKDAGATADAQKAEDRLREAYANLADPPAEPAE